MDVVIDFHMHMIAFEEIRPWVTEYRLRNLGSNAEAFLKKYSSAKEMDALLKENGIDYAIMLPATNPITAGICRTETVVEFCHNSERLIPFATVNPFMVANPAKHIEHYVRDLGCKGVKLYPPYQQYYPNDQLAYPIYAKAAELGVPVMFHTGSSVFKGSRLKFGDPLLLDDVAVDFPDLKLVMAHSGRGFWYDRAFFLARLHKNLYMEISGLPPQNLLTYFPELERNADKIIYGSDWPGMPHLKRNIEMVRSLPLKDETKDKILGLNAAKVLGIGDDLESTP
ncbi:MAG: amidohydrolase [Chloroflexi bacterium]|nr:amidohydrolase [Chloroflexota bacterium]